MYLRTVSLAFLSLLALAHAEAVVNDIPNQNEVEQAAMFEKLIKEAVANQKASENHSHSEEFDLDFSGTDSDFSSFYSTREL
jgi:hypothetical protein